MQNDNFNDRGTKLEWLVLPHLFVFSPPSLKALPVSPIHFYFIEQFLGFVTNAFTNSTIIVLGINLNLTFFKKNFLRIANCIGEKNHSENN